MTAEEWHKWYCASNEVDIIGLIERVQKEVYNQALEDAKKAIQKYRYDDYDGVDWDRDESIDKLKK